MGIKNLRKIPQTVLAKLPTLHTDDLIVATVKRVTRSDVPHYSHFGLRFDDAVLVLPAPRPPLPTMGKYSNANVNGEEVIRRDLPKVIKSVLLQAPNWHNSGTHDVWQTRDVYVRDFIPPKEVNLSIELVEEDADSFTLKFAIDQVLKRDAPDFHADLLYNLNLLQESLGTADIFASTAAFSDYAKTIRVNWEILPVGTVEQTLERMLRGKRPVSEDKHRLMRERLTALARLSPQNYIAGTDEFLRYFGAKFYDDFVAFENLNYGNAMYVMYENWEILSQRSRIDLLKGPRDGFERILHTPGWDDRLRGFLREHRKRKANRK